MLQRKLHSRLPHWLYWGTSWGSLMFALWACWSHLQFCSLRPGTQPVPAMHAAAGASTGLPLMKQQLLLITKELIVGLALQELQANCTL